MGLGTFRRIGVSGAFGVLTRLLRMRLAETARVIGFNPLVASGIGGKTGTLIGRFGHGRHGIAFVGARGASRAGHRPGHTGASATAPPATPTGVGTPRRGG